MKTIIYITNNSLDPFIFGMVQNNIYDSIGDYPLISVSQVPMDFGENICVGPLPYNSLSINIQMMEGLKRVKTKYIAIAEHDCLYTPEHFAFEPPDENVSYYNENVWCLQAYESNVPGARGMFSWFKDRKANSQLICSTKVMLEATQERIDMMSDPAWRKRYPTGRIGEQGAMDYKHAMRLARGKSIAHIRKQLKEYCTKYEGKNFRTKLPNVDIRHHDTLTKNRRGSKRRYKIPHWGTMEDIWNSAS